jgi:hypothetical protein
VPPSGPHVAPACAPELPPLLEPPLLEPPLLEPPLLEPPELVAPLLLLDVLVPPSEHAARDAIVIRRARLAFRMVDERLYGRLS